MDTLPAGIVPMMYAFFGPDGRLDLAAFRRQVDACIKAGVDGIAVLGLATEVGKLSSSERECILETAAEATRGRAPLSVTVFGATPEAQIAFVRAAEKAGASSVILQPPRIPGISEAELLRFFGRVIDAASIPAGIQNAPEYIGIGLGVEAIAALARNHPNFRVLKGEGSAMLIRRTIEATGLPVLNGRGGLELPDNHAAGCAGMIPGAECCDVLARIWHDLENTKTAAINDYAAILPLLVFLMQSMDQFLCYGKRLMAQRLGFETVFDRAPAQAPDGFGLACLARHAAGLRPL
jgi:4-hydroxy-tetrahydrodipicolinate synthase